MYHRTRVKESTLQVNFYINGITLKHTKEFKYLGVIIDSKLSWIQHIAYVKNKISKGMGIMYRARTYLSKHGLINLYNSFIYPYLIYCVDVWGNAVPCHLHSLFLVQKKIIRIMTFSQYLAHTDTLFKS